jgi:hypothetical protein
MQIDSSNVFVDGPYIGNELTFWFTWGQEAVRAMWDTGNTMVVATVLLTNLPGWAVDLLLEWDK